MKLLFALLYIAALGIASHFVGQALPRAHFSPERFPYRAYGWENGGKVYEKLGIKHWKDKLPDMSRIMPDMVKKRMTSDADALIAETCVAEMIHACLMLLSLGIFAFWRGAWAWVFWLVYNIFGNVPFILIQRYNRPRLVKLASRRKRRTQEA